MKHKYRLVRVESPEAPQQKQLNNAVSSEISNQYQERIKAQRPARHHPLIWVAATALTIALVMVACMWMSHVSSSLGHLSQVGAANSKELGHQSGQLSMFQMKLSAVGVQLNQLQNEMRSFFTTIMNHLSDH